MTSPIPINLAFEDELTESLMLRILHDIPTQYATQTIYNRGGNGYLRRSMAGFNNAAKGTPFLVAADLDTYECPTALIEDWLAGRPQHHNLIVRVAIREAEAWVIADREGFARFIGVNVVRIPTDVEALPNPKETLIQLAARSRNRNVRDDICPPQNSTRRVGPNYNGRLSSFVSQNWNLGTARANCRALDRTINRLLEFRPSWVIDA